jgi:hypothetical protein
MFSAVAAFDPHAGQDALSDAATSPELEALTQAEPSASNDNTRRR